MPVIDDLQLTITPWTAIYTNQLQDSSLHASESSVEGGDRKAIVIDFNDGKGQYARDLGTIFKWPTTAGTIIFDWQPSFMEIPEGIYNRATDWDNCGTPGAKFIQGVMIEADSYGASKQFFIQSGDDLSVVPLLEAPATWNGQSARAFSCVPFVAHTVRIISSDGVAWRVWSANFVFQPWPELTRNWTTEMTSLGMLGYGHIRELNIPHVSTSNLALTLTFDQGSPVTITIPHSNGAQRKDKITPPANKFKLVSFSLSSTAPFRVFKEDIEVKAGIWGRVDGYALIRPFGGPSDVGALV